MNHVPGEEIYKKSGSQRPVPETLVGKRQVSIFICEIFFVTLVVTIFIYEILFVTLVVTIFISEIVFVTPLKMGKVST